MQLQRTRVAELWNAEWNEEKEKENWNLKMAEEDKKAQIPKVKLGNQGLEVKKKKNPFQFSQIKRGLLWLFKSMLWSFLWDLGFLAAVKNYNLNLYLKLVLE